MEHPPNPLSQDSLLLLLLLGGRARGVEMKREPLSLSPASQAHQPHVPLPNQGDREPGGTLLVAVGLGSGVRWGAADKVTVERSQPGAELGWQGVEWGVVSGQREQ